MERYTPLHLTLLIQYFCYPYETPDQTSNAGKEYTKELLYDGLIQPRDNEGGSKYSLTDKGEAHLNAMQNLPLPVCQWVTPTDNRT